MQLSFLRGWYFGFGLVLFICLLVPVGQGVVVPTSDIMPALQANGALGHLSQYVGSLRHLHWMQGNTVQYDFWKQATALGDTVRHYADDIITKACAPNAFSADKLRLLKFSMDRLVNSASELRAEVEDAVRHTDVSIDGVSEKLAAELEIVLEALKAEFPPPGDATHHEERSQKISLVLSKAEDAILRVLISHGMAEEAARSQFDKIRRSTEVALVVVGDLVEQHPVLLEVVLFYGAIILIPEAWILRPLLRLCGFGPDGPVKGSLAAWAQRYFWGAAVAEGSWFAQLQRAGMKIRFPPGTGRKIIGSIGAGLGIVGSLFACRNTQ